MEKRTTKLSLIVLCVAGICWLGAINVRAMIGFNLLQPGTLDFKPNIHPYIERTVYALIAQISVFMAYAYAAIWISGTIFLKTSDISLKENGWLMMCAILFYLFTPVEVYTIVLDLKMWYLDYLGSNDLVEFRKLFIHRLAALAGVPIIAVMSYYAIVFLAVFRPMRRARALSSTLI